MSTVPDGWAVVPFTQVFDIQGGTQPPKSTFRYAPAANLIRLLQIRDFGERPVPTYIANKPSLKRCRKDDILIGRYGASVGRICTGMEGAYNVALAKVVIPDGIDQRFVFWLLNSPVFQEPILQIERSAQNGFNKSDLARIQVCIPPKQEQYRIIQKLDEAFCQFNSIRAHLSQVPAILQRFRAAVLTAACSGRLTEDWRAEHQVVEHASHLVNRIKEDHTTQGLGHGGQAALPTEGVHDLSQDRFPDTWAVEELRFLCVPGRPITYGILKPGPDTPGGIPYIRVADFPKDCLNADGVRKTTRHIAEMYRRSALRNGDLLLSIRGTVGRVCRVPQELDGANITQDTARLSIHPEISADYIEAYLRCPSAQKRLERAMKGVAVRGVNIGDVRALQIALPPKDEQGEIATRIKELFKVADVIENHLDKGVARAKCLTQSILSKAFDGELVPTEAELARREGRDYEPASVLLERIRAERADQAKTPAIPKRKLRRASAHV